LAGYLVDGSDRVDGMKINVRPIASTDIDAVVALSLRAWAPVFSSFETVLGEKIYERVYPDWLSSQAQEVEQVCRDHAERTWVAVDDEIPVGFITVVLNDKLSSGDIEMLAVDPAHQRCGVAQALISFALDYMRTAGVQVAGVVTGGDPGHAPARRTYEKAGFTALPLVRYYQAL
jgi:GNAT superfamily N-acetyltransferase